MIVAVCLVAATGCTNSGTKTAVPTTQPTSAPAATAAETPVSTAAATAAATAASATAAASTPAAPATATPAATAAATQAAATPSSQMAITAAGSGTYTIGDTIHFSGTNKATKNVYLMTIGPMSIGKPYGANMGNFRQMVFADDPTSFDPARVTVNSDGSWKYDWTTPVQGMVAGDYTIYAAAEPYTADDLSGVVFNTMKITINSK